MSNSPKKILVILLALSLAALVAWYVYFQSKDLIDGPQIQILSPANGTVFTDPFIHISGKTKNIARISLDDRPIFVGKDGLFTDSLLLEDGYNIIEIAAEDKFGRKTEKILKFTLINQ